ncbi:MAG: hypothetical protein RL318_1658 [Fibrobacterota bacterium]|jgi:endoglucanase
MGKARVRFLAGVVACAAAMASASIVAENGMLKKQGNQIVGERSGKPVQVAGMSLYWSIWGGQSYYNAGVVDTLAISWNASLVRAAIAADNVSTTVTDQGYVQNPTAQLALARKVIDAAIARDIYVLVDWHDHNANLHVDQAKEFFSTLAAEYGDKPNVIWEIWNEPDKTGGTGTGGKDTWADITGYAAQVIPVIRAKSQNLIVVGTPNWSQDVDVAAAAPLSDANIAYTLHFYAGTHGASLRTKAETALSKGAALFITEFGTTTADGGQRPSASNGNVDNYKIYPAETKAWLDWADTKGISWANWSITTKDEASAALKSGANIIGKWRETNFTESGLWIRDRLRARERVTSIGKVAGTKALAVRRTGGMMQVTLPEGADQVRLMDLSGRVLGDMACQGASLEIPWSRPGVVVVQAMAGRQTVASRMVASP